MLEMRITYMSMNSFIVFLNMTRPLLYTSHISMISVLSHVADKCIKYSGSIRLIFTEGVPVLLVYYK